MKRGMIAMPEPGELENLSDKTKEPKGLCSCCKFFETCTYPKDPSQPVLQCDEFQGIESPSPPCLTTVSSSVRDIRPPPSPAEQEVRTLRGLCSNCELRDTCTYPKPEGGVWHCEEYQ